MRAQEVGEAPVVNTTVMDGRWRRSRSSTSRSKSGGCGSRSRPDSPRCSSETPERALQWRLHVRQMFQDYFAKGYRAVDFVLQREAGFGRYLLARDGQT